MGERAENRIREENRYEIVLARYRELPTEQLIAESVLFTHDPALGPRLAGAVAMGFSRSGHYVDTARGLMDEMFANAEQISWHMSAYYTIRNGIGEDYGDSPLAIHAAAKAASHELGAKTLNLRSEVHWHLYAECLLRAWLLMSNTAKHFDPGLTLKPKHEAYLTTLREFRNHMTHRDKAIANIDSPDWLSMSRGLDDWYEVGYKRDNRNRVVFSPVSGDLKGRTLKMPMNPEGFREFKNIIAYVYERLERFALAQLARQFADHPETMPTEEEVGTFSRDYIELVR